MQDEQSNSVPELDLPLELGKLAESLQDCSKHLASEKADQLDEAFGRIVDMVNRRRRILNLVQEALSQLRLDVKYLMFDLEVTRRERDELQARLEDTDRGFE